MISNERISPVKRYRDLPNLISHLKKSHVREAFREELNQLYAQVKRKHSVLMDVNIEASDANVCISINYHLCDVASLNTKKGHQKPHQ